MPRIKWLVDYAGYKKGQEFDVVNIKTLRNHLDNNRIEILKTKSETATAPAGENAMLKAGKTHTRKASKK